MITFHALILCAAASAQTPEAPPREPIERHLIEAGEALPAFDLVDLDGRRFSSSTLAGKVSVIVFARPESDNSTAVLRDLERARSTVKEHAWERVVVFPGAIEKAALVMLVDDLGLGGPVLVDPDRTAYAAFRIVAVPSLVLVDAEGKVAFSHAGYGVTLYSNLVTAIRRAFGEARRIEGTRPRSSPRVQLARRLMELDDLGRAEELLEKELAGEPPLDAYTSYAELLVLRKRPERALAVLGEARTVFKDDPRIDVAMARALGAQGKLGEATRLLDDVIRASPRTWEAHVALGEVHEARGDKDRALAAYRAAIAILRSPWRGGPR